MMSGKMRKKSLKIRKSDKTIDGYMVNIPTRHVTKNTLVSTKSCDLSEDPTNDHLVTESSPDISASKRIVITNHFNGSICDALMDEDNGSDWEDVFETDSVSNGSQAKPMAKVKSSRRTASTPRISTTTTKSRRLSSSNMKPKLRKSSRHKKRSSSVCDTSYHVKNSPRHVQTTLKDHYTVRRSTRKCKSVLKDEMYDDMVRKLENQEEDGLEVVDVEGKGRGIVATKHFSKGDFICEYSGELTTEDTARCREVDYQKDCLIGCYMYYFMYNGKKYCIDATQDNGRYGRLINHSRTAPNVVTKVFAVGNHPYLCLMAGRDIEPGEELQYDYGDRRKSALDAHPWLKH